LLVSADVSSLMNSGFIIFRNSPWTINFLQSWLAISVQFPGFNDQMGFEYVYNNLSEKDRSKIEILPPDALNSNAPPMGLQLPHNQILHLAAESSSMRSEVFKLGAEETCKAIGGGRQVKPQLGLTQSVLRSTAETV
jgi:hypothetical protein